MFYTYTSTADIEVNVPANIHKLIQRGTKIEPGNNVGIGKDHTLFATVNGTVKYEFAAKNKKRVSVYSE